MNLIIFDKSFNSINLINSKKNILKDNKNYVINFCYDDLFIPDWLIYKKLDISNSIFSQYKNKSDYIVSKIKKELLLNPVFAEYKFSEINYSDNIWEIYYTILAIKSVIKKKKIKKIFFFSNVKNNYLSSALKESFKNIYIHSYKYNNFYYKLQNLTKIYLIFFNNFLQEFLLSLILLIFYKAKIFKKQKFLYANFPNHWDIKKKNYKILEKNKKNIYLVSLLRNNSNLLKKFTNFFLLKSSNIQNIIILESYSNPLDIIYIYSKNLLTKNKNITIRLLSELKLGFTNNDIERNYRLIERSKNETFLKNLNRFNKSNKPKIIVYPFFEFIDGRLLSKFCKNSKILSLGFQHSYLLANNYSRFFDAIKSIYKSSLIDYLPNKIFVESPFVKKNLSILKSNKIEYYGSFRLQNIYFLKKINKSNNNILFIMDLHNKKYLEQIIKKIKQTDKSEIYVRPHPLYYKEYKNKKFENLNINVDIYKNLSDSIRKNKIKYVIISSSTSAFIELLNTKLDIIIYKMPNYIRDNSILDKYFYSIKNINDLSNLKYNKKMTIPKNIFLPKKITTNDFFKKYTI
jgi:hypothetical protein